MTEYHIGTPKTHIIKKKSQDIIKKTNTPQKLNKKIKQYI